jgi:hypothetical protein
MEAPYLHYTIGTRVTPRVADNLKQAGISVIMANKQPAPFSPVIMRAQDSAAHDPDWMARLAGFGLEKSFLDAVQHGSTSDIKGTSYVPKLVEADL